MEQGEWGVNLGVGLITQLGVSPIGKVAVEAAITLVQPYNPLGSGMIRNICALILCIFFAKERLQSLKKKV